MSTNRKETIEELAVLARKVLVKFSRPFDAGSTEGYVLAAGPEFFLVAELDDGLRFNGFGCYRYKDVLKLRAPEQFAPFVEAVLKKRVVRVPRKPKVKLSSLTEILLTSATLFPLVTIQRERQILMYVT